MRLRIALENKVAYHQIVHFRVYETPVGIVRCANDRFTANVEGRVDQQRTLRLSLKCLQQSIESWINLTAHRLNSR